MTISAVPPKFARWITLVWAVAVIFGLIVAIARDFAH